MSFNAPPRPSVSSRLTLRVGASLTILTWVLLAASAKADDWNRFRGANGSGVASDEHAYPTEWSDTYNLKWKLELPGPGASSPIVVGDRVFVTCWSGYGTSRTSQGDQSQLKRHLIAVDRKSGEILWNQAVPAVLPEDRFGGMFAENGYATHTPVSDGEKVYVFFGKSGVLAFDLDGKQLWQTSVGTRLDRRGWGSASSPILYDNLVIVTAAAESNALVALDKLTGKVVWREEADGFASTWGTPVLVKVDDERTDLVLAVPGEIWAFNPSTGKFVWYATGTSSDSMCSSVVAHDNVVYSVEGRSGGSIAVKAGGKDDVTKTHVVWSGRDRSRITTPVYHQGRLYWINGGIANCIDAKTGARIYQSRLETPSRNAPPNVAQAPGGRTPGRFGGGAGGRGGMGGIGGQDYSSPVVANGNMIYITRSGNGVVVKLGDTFEQLKLNRFESDNSDFHATPALSQGEIFIRSNAYLYCVSEQE